MYIYLYVHMHMTYVYIHVCNHKELTHLFDLDRHQIRSEAVQQCCYGPPIELHLHLCC